MQISYQAIYHPSSFVRRLRNVSQLSHFVARAPQHKDVLANKLKEWSADHKNDFTNYKYNIGAAHSMENSGKNHLAAGYLKLSVKLGLLSEISNVFHLARIGRVLYCLLNYSSSESDNLFFLTVLFKGTHY